MLRENWIGNSRLTRITDNLVVVAAFFLAYIGRQSLLYWDALYKWNLPFGGEKLAPLNRYYIVLFVGLPLFNLIWSILGAYDRNFIFNSWRVLKTSCVTAFLAFFGIAACLFLMKLDLSRVVIIFFCAFVALGIAGERYLLRGFLRYWNRKGRNSRNIIIVGAGEQGLKIQSEISSRPELGLKVVGFSVFEENIKSEKIRTLGFKIFVGAHEFEEALKRYAVDEAIFTDVRSNFDIIESMVIVCTDQGVRTSLAADLFSVGMAKSEVSYFGGMPLIHYETPPGERWELFVKRAFDCTLASILLILFAPVLLIIALGIRIMSPGPIIFKQKRVGLNGRIFSMYKFRSMKVGAEQELEELIANNEMDGPVFKMKDDPRVTSFGRFLRRFSLDELPQLFNVFRGDMSLVGPRPPVPGEVTQYERRYRRRLSMRPGLTCIWQVSGRNEIKDFDTWMRLDLEYIDNWSLLMDLRILAKTIPAVIFGYGAR